MSVEKSIPFTGSGAAAGLKGGALNLDDVQKGSPPGRPLGRMATAMGLQRELGLFSLTNIVVANMIGAGVLTLAGFLLTELRNPLVMMVLWFIGGVGALCGAVCYGRLGAAFPMAGGEYVYLSRLFHPLAGFLSGWISFFVGFSAPIAAAALAIIEYATRAFPSILGPDVLPGSATALFLKKFYAILIIILCTMVHCRGVRLGARVQNGLTFIKIAGIVLFVVAGFAFGRGNLGHLLQGRGLNLDFAQCKSIGLSFLWIMFAYSGWNASAYIGSEARSPRRNLPRSLILGTAAVMILYLALNLLYVFAIPAGEMSRTTTIGGLAAAKLFGRSLDRVFSIFIALALFSSLSAYVMLGPRVYFSMARDGLFFRFAAKVHPRTKVPSRSILFQGAIAAAMVLIGSFEQLLTYLGFALGIFPILAVVGVFKLKRQEKLAGAPGGTPLAAVFFIVTSILMLVLSLLERPTESLIAIATLLLGIPLYFFVFRGERK